jgi:hypothetical protein
VEDPSRTGGGAVETAPRASVLVACVYGDLGARAFRWRPGPARPPGAAARRGVGDPVRLLDRVDGNGLKTPGAVEQVGAPPDELLRAGAQPGGLLVGHESRLPPGAPEVTAGRSPPRPREPAE